ncbi:MAG TPA: hypothetical protein VI636_09335 [Candidatus Angelobacter sp.]
MNPGSYGTWGVYCIDPQYAGGTVTYIATSAGRDKCAGDGIIWVGVITTVSGGGGIGTGGGNGDGLPGGMLP